MWMWKEGGWQTHPVVQDLHASFPPKVLVFVDWMLERREEVGR